MPTAIQTKQNEFLYQQVIAMVLSMRDSVALRPGDKLPSLRSFSRSLNVSIPTVRQAYIELERLGLVEARPKSGYFLRVPQGDIVAPKKVRAGRRPRAVKKQSLIEDVFDAIHQPGSIPLGLANPSSAYPSDKALARIMRRVLASSGEKALTYAPMEGFVPLRRQLARRYLEYGLNIDPDEVIITNGGQEAIAIAVQCVANAGDVIAVESPTYFGVLELIESFGMQALEIPLCPQDGVCADDLEAALSRHKVKAVVLSSSVSNPLGSFQSDTQRAKIVAMLEAKAIPLIEDDVYGDLYFTEQRGSLARCHSNDDLVLSCSSFSKTAAPGYRIGWMLPGRYLAKAKRIKRALSCSSSLLNQWTLSDFIASGEYDRNLRMLRNVLKTNKQRALALVQEHFPAGTKVNDPKGGSVLWVQLPNGCDGSQLFKSALEHNISIAPGDLFSPGDKFKDFVRISFGVPWSDRVEASYQRLGELIDEQ